ncbi:Mss4-like protein [Fusarium venenatum]|uniref:Mss4-like protein n=1 Tax=Fusarium venenatum TaxID=56646 RepID=UPI001DA80757|nr:Mss4-like protein [Fusarium venenatum]
MAVSTADKSKPCIPHAGQARDGWSTEDRATASCYCGKVQLSFPINKGKGLVNTFVCNCVDCRKITASMFASNFIVENSFLEHIRGQDLLKTYSQNETIVSGKAMTNHFCSNCGSLMYRVSERFPDLSILRIGTVDDFSLHETKLRPVEEHWTKDRVSWFPGVTDVEKTFPGQG